MSAHAGQAVSPDARMTHQFRTAAMTDAGVALVSATAIFAARLLYERTAVTWFHGAQAVGLAPLHSALNLIGALVVLLAVLWALVVLIPSAVKRSRISGTDWTLVAILVLCCGVWAVPHEQWKLLAVRAHGTQHVPADWVVSAAAAGEMHLLDYLLAHGVDVNTRAQYGQSPLGAAAAAGQTETARMLIARGARLDTRTAISLETPLTEAAQMNRSAIVELLLDHGADPGAKDVMDRTALDWARKNGNYRMAMRLQARSKD